MEAGPRNTAHGREHDTAQGVEGQDTSPGIAASGEGDRPVGPALGAERHTSDALTQDGPGTASDDAGDAAPEHGELTTEPEVEVELRPQRRLRIWQLAPIVAFAAVGSLMFAFPLAFEFGDGGAVVAMLGLLICSCAAGWGVMAARRAGTTWPGLPQRGSGRRPDWRVVALYAVVVVATASLAVWRVARLR